MSLRGRLDRLERACRCRCADGVVTVGAVLIRDPGEPMPKVPDDLPACPVCGAGAVVLVEELVVVGGPEGSETTC
jgi:hypothetical protein